MLSWILFRRWISSSMSVLYVVLSWFCWTSVVTIASPSVVFTSFSSSVPFPVSVCSIYVQDMGTAKDIHKISEAPYWAYKLQEKTIKFINWTGKPECHFESLICYYHDLRWSLGVFNICPTAWNCIILAAVLVVYVFLSVHRETIRGMLASKIVFFYINY